jgi:hypothetical protein
LQYPGADPTLPPVRDVPGQRFELLELQQAPPDAGSQLRRGQVKKQRGLTAPPSSHRLHSPCPSDGNGPPVGRWMSVTR